MNKGPKVFGYVELNKEGMNLVNTPSPGPYPIIDMDHNFGVEILDHRRTSHWIMKGNYNQLGDHTVHVETYQEKVDQYVKMARGQNGHVQDVQEKIESIKELVNIQGMDGNWNMDDYMCGIFNGMELILATLEDREPVYKKLKKGDE